MNITRHVGVEQEGLRLLNMSVRSQFLGSRNADVIRVADRGELETGSALNGKIVFVTDGTVCKKPHSDVLGAMD